MTKSHHIFSEERVSLYKQIMEKQLTFAYVGEFNDVVNDALIPIAENIIKKSNAPRFLRKRTFYIMIECIQNVNRHHFVIESPDKMPRELFLVQGDEGFFSIASANVMKSEDAPSLHSKLEKLNSLSEFGLDLHYKTLLKETVLSQKGGAGLGLIEVARKSSNAINFKFIELSDANTFFLMESIIQKDKEDKPDPPHYSLDYMEDLYDFYKDHAFNLTLKGNCASNTLEEIELMIGFVNKINHHPFIENPESPILFHQLINLIPTLCFSDTGFVPDEMIFQFEHLKDSKLFNIGWIVPVAYSKDCETNFHSLFAPEQTGETSSEEMMVLLGKIKESLSGEVLSKIIHGNKNDDLFVLSFPVG
jgi:hypothetical protein